MYALSDMSTSLGFAIGPLLGSALKHWFSFSVATYVFACLCLVAAPLQLKLRGLLARWKQHLANEGHSEGAPSLA